ncbi:proteasome ATPase [Corynebacterium sp. ES2715-CONJ3]|uniref:proteasome ATPase n=1 Tax=Corynebacterium sp. ES2715-CONJ3 TaxID=2974028 RepID=UPI0021698BD7|nr:proteasome ATPase [Corynebacterium sp. ES2715-CONJ3]MCS4491153.1 proteasome ATPase [Corynebacterium sp. ES2715-CONJ3]
MQSSTTMLKLQRENRELQARAAKMADLLKASRHKLEELHGQLEEMAAPPSTYGVYLEQSPREGYAEVFTSNRRMRVAISPLVDPRDLLPGKLVRLGEGNQVVEVCHFQHTGALGTLLEVVDSARVLVATQTGEEKILRIAHDIKEQLKREARPGDTLLVDERSGYAFEVIPKTEVSRLALEEVPHITYEDVGGLAEQIEQIHDAVELPFLEPELYRRYNLTPPKGVLLYGPPGCGKTLIAKAVAHSLAERTQRRSDPDGSRPSSYFINVKGPELLNKYVGETERRIRLIFERARDLASEGRPVIVFFDEMESIFRTRGSGVSSDMETTVVPQLLTELDGVEKLKNVIVIGATNREELIDPAILRPGRLDIKIRVGRPDAAKSRDIFAKHLGGDIPHAEDISVLIDNAVEYMFADHPFVELVLRSGTVEVLHYRDFASGAMIANIVDRAKKYAIKDQLQTDSASGITSEHLRRAIDAENMESEDMPNTSHPHEWSRILGRHGLEVQEARVIGGSL